MGGGVSGSMTFGDGCPAGAAADAGEFAPEDEQAAGREPPATRIAIHRPVRILAWSPRQAVTRSIFLYERIARGVAGHGQLDMASGERSDETEDERS